MKKLIIIVLTFLITTPCFAMKLNYKIADGEVVSMGEMPDLTAGSGERVVVVDFPIPEEALSHFTFDGAELQRKSQPVIDKLEAEQNFDTVVMRKRLFEILGTLSNFNLRLEVGAMEAFGESRNYAGMKQYLDMLVSNGVATADDLTAIKAVIYEQNVDLEDYAS